MPGAGITIGVEEEFFLVDSSGSLTNRGPEVAAADSRWGELQHEMAQWQVESATAICHDLSELVTALRELRRHLSQRARSLGVQVVPSGTAVLGDGAPVDVTPDPRYEQMAADFRRITDVGSTCGGHVHVGVPDRETGVAVLNHVRPWLPLLLALTANSPYDDGIDSGYASWRYVSWARWPSAGPPPLLSGLDEYEATVDLLVRSGAMIDRAMNYWYVRLSEQHPTVEFRVGDVGATAEEAALAGVLARGLVARALEDIGLRLRRPDGSTDALRANLWRAARDGLSGACLHPVTGELGPVLGHLGGLVDDLRPVLKHSGDIDFVDDVLARLREVGGGADRQRAAFARRHRLTDVVDDLADDLTSGPFSG